ncbi:MAG TPA: penicillin acylase family protein, partial [Gemmatimonadaceae bacterium]|nr:penicillin acylase family protein [Gemmatimonadaceae bacterium]
MRKVLFSLTSLACLYATPVASQSRTVARGTQILWDTYGVPHIFAKDRNGLAYAFGWAQMQNHGDLLLRLVAQSRGRASEYLNADYLDEDRWVWKLDLRGNAERALAAQGPEMRAHLESFVAG